ncbi:MAG: hypothetical protein HC913_17920 [Microscillaceae bacterium]|nr:hypothetical protein [Microscillaceae bacterium]
MKVFHFYSKLLRRAVPLWYLSSFLCLSAQTPYNDCAIAEINPAATLTGPDAGIFNQNFNVPGAPNLVDPSPAITGAQTDSWFELDVDVNGLIELEYTPTSGQNAALALYVANAGGNCATKVLLRFVNNFGVGNTETISANVFANNRYFVRVLNMTDTNLMTGTISIFRGGLIGDICNEAEEVSIGTCDFEYEINSSFFNLEGRPDPTGLNLSKDVRRDGWIKFTATSGKRVGIEYISVDKTFSAKDVAIAVYSGNCGALVQRGFSDILDEGGREVLEIDIPADGTYFLRLMNVEDSESVTGSLCVYEVRGRDLCSGPNSVVTAPLLRLGDCNVRVNVVNNADYTASSNIDCGNAFANRDVWLRYQHTDPAITEVRFEYTAYGATGTDEPEISVYTATGFDCNNSGTSRIACEQDGTFTSRSFAFAVINGETYYIRIADGIGDENIYGTICLYDDGKRAEDNFFTASTFTFDNNDCGRQFNVFREFNENGNIPNLNPTITCAPETIIQDAWATFTTGASLPAGLTQIVLEYDNDNSDPSDAFNVGLMLYTGPIFSLGNATANQIENERANATVTLVADFVYENIVIGNTPLTDINGGDPFIIDGGGVELYDYDGDVWGQFVPGANGRYTFVFQTSGIYTNPGQKEAFVVYDASISEIGGGLVEVVPGSDFASATYDLTGGSTYFIRLLNARDLAAPSVVIANGTFAIYSELTQVGTCVDAVNEGVETFLLGGANLQTNTKYYIRVGVIDNRLSTSNKATVTGTLCIRDNTVEADDVCATARELVVGDCNIEFNLIDANLPFNQPGFDTNFPPQICRGGDIIRADAWAEFKATATRTTIEYANLSNTGQDAAIVVYEGNSCGVISPVGGGNCANFYEDEIGPVAGIESITVNTRVNQTYYIQILNLGTANMNGRLCIFNTIERNVCDDNDLLDLIPDACNIRMNVPADFTNNGVDLTATSPTNPPILDGACPAIAFPPADQTTPGGTRDAWVRIVGNGQVMTLQYENGEATSNPMMVLYTSLAANTRVDCGTGLNGAGNPANQYACANDVNSPEIQTESMTFQSDAGRLYILRLIDLEPVSVPGVGMTGNLCIFSGVSGPDDCSQAIEIDIRAFNGDDQGACNVQFNVLDENACGNPAVNCGSSGSVANGFYNAGGPNVTFGADTWVADAPTSTGSTTTSTAAAIANTTLDALYQTNRRSINNLTYALTGIAPGTYQVSLHFAEIVAPQNFNMGGGTVNTPTNGSNATFTADDPGIFTGGTGTLSTFSSAAAINNTNDDIIYQSNRRSTGTLTYAIPVANGRYDVQFHFCELENVSNGARRFNLQAEGSNLLTNFDVRQAAGGQNRPRVETRTITVTDGVLNVVLTATTAMAQISAIRVFPNNQFDVQIEGISRLAAYNVLANAGGYNTARIETFNINIVGTLDISLNPLSGSAAQISAIQVSSNPGASTCEGSGWAYFTTGLATNQVGNVLPGTNITVQYDNTNNNSLTSPDVTLEIYREIGALGTFDCNNPATFEYVGCSDIISGGGDAAEGVEEVNFSIDPLGGERFFVRVISKSNVNTAFGKLCIFYGQTIARPNCAEAIDYGPLNGTWKGFEVLSNWNNITPTDRITNPPCVVPGGSNPVAPNPPIVSNGWLRFTVPISDPPVEAVTVQFDNVEFSSTDVNSENAAIAIYAGDCSTGALVDCANNVWRGTESLTIAVVPGTYFVRVMNVKNIGKNMPGRIRVFEFVRGDFGPELVVDGNFAGWGAINTTADPNPAPNPLSGMDRWIYDQNNPVIDRYRRNESTADLSRQIDRYSTFATDYGYLEDAQRDVADNPVGANTLNSFARLRAQVGEFNPEGRYAVSQQSITRKSGGNSTWDFYGYGNGETGWGGGINNATYCANPTDPNIAEACSGFPGLVPAEAIANFMHINGWKKADGATGAGKVWCQTMDIGASPEVRYYVFSAWFQNLIRCGVNLDVPQLRVSICDMEDPNNPGPIANTGVVVAGATGNTRNVSSNLPGVTFTPPTYSGMDNGIGAVPDLTYHFPEPPENADMEKVAPIGFSFGAAMPCNLTGESPNARLKVLGSDFYLPECPDQWTVLRCVYRAPLGVSQFNLCIENLSLTKDGNDFAIDDISLREYIIAPEQRSALEALLRGDACELADELRQRVLSSMPNCLILRVSALGSK